MKKIYVKKEEDILPLSIVIDMERGVFLLNSYITKTKGKVNSFKYIQSEKANKDTLKDNFSNFYHNHLKYSFRDIFFNEFYPNVDFKKYEDKLENQILGMFIFNNVKYVDMDIKKRNNILAKSLVEITDFIYKDIYRDK